jgi:putative SOS response-associated peptidase YedK
MKLHLVTDLQEITQGFHLNDSKDFIPPKESITRGEYAPIIRRGDQLEQSTLFSPELVYARWGLVPNEYCSIRDADRFGLHAIRFERLKFSRALSKIYPNRRCLIPSTGLSLDGVDRLEPGGLRLVAGVWTRFLRPMLRVESFSIFTRLTEVGREAVVLEPIQGQRWLNPNTSSRELRALAEGWWKLEDFSRQIEAELRYEARVQHEEFAVVADGVRDLMPVAREKPRFVPGDQVLNPERHVGEVLEVQPRQKHPVLVRYRDGLELWHSGRELHHSRM